MTEAKGGLYSACRTYQATLDSSGLNVYFKSKIKGANIKTISISPKLKTSPSILSLDTYTKTKCWTGPILTFSRSF